MSVPSANSGKHTLCVEGPDDVHVISKLLHNHGLTRLRNPKNKSVNPLELFLYDSLALDIQPCGGIEEAIGKFEAAILNIASNPRVIGLVIDNDPDQNRERQISELITRIQQQRIGGDTFSWNTATGADGILVPGGFIAEPANDVTPRISYWLMPDNQNEGMLEDFLAQIIPYDRNDLRDFAINSAQQAKSDYKAPYKDCHATKAAMHTYLAWQDEPGKPFGLAFDQKSFDSQHALAVGFVAWIQRLFSPGESVRE